MPPTLFRVLLDALNGDARPHYFRGIIVLGAYCPLSAASARRGARRLTTRPVRALPAQQPAPRAHRATMGHLSSGHAIRPQGLLRQARSQLQRPVSTSRQSTEIPQNTQPRSLSIRRRLLHLNWQWHRTPTWRRRQVSGGVGRHRVHHPGKLRTGVAESHFRYQCKACLNIAKPRKARSCPPLFRGVNLSGDRCWGERSVICFRWLISFSVTRVNFRRSAVFGAVQPTLFALPAD